ncbi:MAG: hypothetical protein RL701_1321 [Pseudomonadota bacterium]
MVGVCRVAFSLPGNASLKGKRSVVRRIVDRTRAKFNVAVAEVDQLDSHRQAVIGFAVVSNDGPHANSMLDHISSFMAGISEAVLVDRTLEIVHIGGTARPLPLTYKAARPPQSDAELAASPANFAEEWDDDDR